MTTDEAVRALNRLVDQMLKDIPLEQIRGLFSLIRRERLTHHQGSEAQKVLIRSLGEDLVESYRRAVQFGSARKSDLASSKLYRKRLIKWFMAAVEERFLSLEAKVSLARQYGQSADVRLWRAHGVVCIVVGGKIENFVPQAILLKTDDTISRVDIRGGELNLRMAGSLAEWVRTRWGYALGKGIFFEALKAECSSGVYGRATKTVRR